MNFGSWTVYFLPVQPDVLERDLHQVADRVRLAAGDDVVVRLVLLEHEPHGPDVVAGEAPVAASLEVADAEFLLQPELDPGDRVGHLAGDELLAATRAIRG